MKKPMVAVMFVVALFTLVLISNPSLPLQAQTATATAVPRLVRFAGTASDLDGNPMTGVAGITFSLYAEQSGGAPLWLETQNAQADASGHYSVLLGSTKPDGLPAELFTSAQARWVGVQISGQAEQPRVLLVSAPYALKAGDAETVGGLPASAFVLANSGNVAANKRSPATGGTTASDNTKANAALPANPNVTGKGTVDYIPMWDKTTDIVNSVMFQKSSQIGISTTAPAALLDVNGKTDVRDTLTLFPKGTDNTLAINGTSFKINNKGLVTFISGQTFPGVPLLAAANTFTASQTFDSSVDSNFSYAAGAFENSNFSETIGLWGYSASGIGIGTYSEAVGASTEGKTNGYIESASVGVWADTTGDGTTEFGGIGVLSTVDMGYSIIGLSNSDLPTSFFENDDTFEFADTLETYGGSFGGECDIDVQGDLSCSGSITPVAGVDGGFRKVALNTISSPESWFEDAGSAQLSNGKAVVNIEPVFGQTVNTGMEYHVFLTPKGDCQGLYVSNETPQGFEVHELRGGTSSIAFDYRIMAKRKGFEKLRLADKTRQFSKHGPVKRTAGTRAPNPDDYRKAQMKKAGQLTKLEQPVVK